VVAPGETCSAPDVPFAPVQPSLAVHAVVPVLVHDSVLDCPELMNDGSAVRMSETPPVGVTVTVADFEAVPPGPAQVSV
jgi:hypothetical protein